MHICYCFDPSHEPNATEKSSLSPNYSCFLLFYFPASREIDNICTPKILETEEIQPYDLTNAIELLWGF